MSDKKEPEVEQTQPSQEDQLKSQSAQLGQNMQAFLDQVKLSARTEEERRILNVYSDVMGVVEKLAKGELIIINTQSLTMTEPAVDEDKEAE